MKKEEIIKQIEGLIKEADDIKYDDYSGAKKVIDHFENFVAKYYDYLNPYVLENIGLTKSHFSEMLHAKKENKKLEAWRNGCHDLRIDIEAMLTNNKFPDELPD